MSPRNYFQHFARLLRPEWLERAFPPPHVTRLIMQSVLVGIVAGMGSFVFSRALEISTDVIMHQTCGVELPVEASRRRVPVVKMVASLCTMATGGNAGREGPVAQVSPTIRDASSAF